MSGFPEPKDVVLLIFSTCMCRFTDPKYWLEYFPPLAKSDLKSLGLKVRV